MKHILLNTHGCCPSVTTLCIYVICVPQIRIGLESKCFYMIIMIIFSRLGNIKWFIIHRGIIAQVTHLCACRQYDISIASGTPEGFDNLKAFLCSSMQWRQNVFLWLVQHLHAYLNLTLFTASCRYIKTSVTQMTCTISNYDHCTSLHRVRRSLWIRLLLSNYTLFI